MGIVLAGGLAAAGLCLHSAAAAPATAVAPPTDEALKTYDIPAQPLTSAVEAYALATGIQVLYDRPIGAEPRSPGVSGTFSPRAALVRLLVGTGLVIHFTDDRNVILELPKAAHPDAKAPADRPPRNLPSLELSTLEVVGPLVLEAQAPPDEDARLYGTLIKSSVAEALARDPKTSRGQYLAGLSLWIAPSGTIRHASVFRSSGNAERDAAIRMVLEKLTLGEHPPLDLLQPVNIQIQSRPHG